MTRTKPRHLQAGVVELSPATANLKGDRRQFESGLRKLVLRRLCSWTRGCTVERRSYGTPPRVKTTERERPPSSKYVSACCELCIPFWCELMSGAFDPLCPAKGHTRLYLWHSSRKLLHEQKKELPLIAGEQYKPSTITLDAEVKISIVRAFESNGLPRRSAGSLTTLWH